SAEPAKPARQLHATPETSAMRTALSPQRPHASGAVPVNFTKRFSRLLNVQAAPGLPMLPVEISVARAESINLSASQDVRRRGSSDSVNNRQAGALARSRQSLD